MAHYAPMRVIRRAKGAFDWVWAVFSVLGVLATVFWLIDAIESAHGLFAHQSLDGNLVLALLLLLAGTFFWGLRRGGGPNTGHHTHLPVLPEGGEEEIEADIDQDGKFRMKRKRSPGRSSSPE